MIERITRLRHLAVGGFERGGQRILITGEQRQRCDSRRRIAQHNQAKIPGRGRRGNNPAVTVRFQAFAERRLNAAFNSVDFITPETFLRYKAQGDGLIEFATRRRQQAVSCGQRQMRRN